MMCGTLGKVWCGLVCTIALVAAGCALKEVEPTPPELVRPAAVLRPAPQFKPVKGAEEGVEEADLVTQLLPQLRSRLEIRTILVPAGKPVTLPVEYEGVLELRAGSVVTIIDGKNQPHQRGEMWQVAKGSRVRLQASGELAVLRAIYLVPGEK